MQLVRFRIDLNPECSIGPGKIQLLEAIGRSGSIRQAAKDLGMSYRRAWLLVDSINRSFMKPATSSSIGGTGGGGVELTDFGSELIQRYQALNRRIESLVRSEFADMARMASPASARAARSPKKAKGVTRGR